MNFTDPFEPERVLLHQPGPGVAERDEALVECVRQCLHDLSASSVAIYLYAEATSTLNAAVMAVSPLGVASLESLAVADDAYASAAAYRSGEVTTRHSIDIQGKHPEFAISLAVSVSFPSTVSAAPLASGMRRFGTLTAFWPEPFRALPEEDRAYLLRTADLLSRRLDALAANGVSMAPAPLPLVVSAEPPESGTDGSAQYPIAPRTAPLVYHLHKLTLLLTSTRHTREATTLALERIAPAFRARAISISLIEGDRLHLAGASGCSREYLRTLDGLPLSRDTPETDAISQRRRLVYPGTSEATRGRLLETQSTEHGDRDCTWVVLPLTASDRVVGVCSLGLSADSPDVKTTHAVLTALSTLLGQSFERTQLYDAQYALAEKLQQALLPRMLPQPPGVVATSRYVPAVAGADLGGDWYDLIGLADGSVVAVIGDVQGHNTTAAVVMGQLHSAVRAYATEGHDPVTVLKRTNRLLLELETDLFATCCCVLFDPAADKMRVATAGSLPPFIRTADGHALSAEAEIGVPLGVQENPDYRVTDVPLTPGTLIALYTDGLAGSDDEFAHALGSAVGMSEGELETLADRIVATAVGLRSRGDDAAMLLLRYEGARERAQANVREYVIQRRDLQGVHRTREQLRKWLVAWELPELADTAELLASEVVTNALVHGDSDVNVYVRRYETCLRVEVRDSDPRPAEPVTLPRAEDQAEGGRGLLIVSALASGWGNSPSGRGKTVWFELMVPADDRRTLAHAGTRRAVD
ncbi:serine/threonine-protein phosphatase [Streptomyces sp. TG1A-8]|uniref:ATP-binding SpoIIE family protein phosphatase n=1 Tax=Streptomyces sp. TG1A-8 TaxID=3051385 RepID=UPI00265BB2D7|nr:ATP-binding SpoIIE family protein phosphatase [Streptomyces sp. TG1A-8]MDO0929637.1 serine/threonine-protein phosphatase [Streptomyces sp. TG1A-8]